jgi:hypothetical protein
VATLVTVQVAVLVVAFANVDSAFAGAVSTVASIFASVEFE